MVHEAADGIGRKVGEERHRDGTVSIGCKEGNGPAGGIGGAYGHFLSRDDPGGLEQDVQPGDLGCDIPESEFIATPVAQRLVIPVLPGVLCKKLQIIDHNLSYFVCFLFKNLSKIRNKRVRNNTFTGFVAI